MMDPQQQGQHELPPAWWTPSMSSGGLGYDPPSPESPRRRNGGRDVAVATGAALAIAAVVGVVFAAGGTPIAGIGSAAVQPAIARQGINPQTGGGSNGGSGGASSGGTTSSTTASATQSIGVVDINTVLGYQQARAAGTGIVLTSSGEILTNNHVVDGATKITVTVVSTAAVYTARVVGTDPSDDVAVIQLSNASGLQTANISESSVRVGDAITGVGNAGGAGGVPSAAQGQVTAVDQQLTASDTNGQNAEQLTGMIETNAPIEAGDSGGPLYNASNKVIGIDTAATTNGRATTAGYAIPIGKALSIAAKITSGHSSTTIHLGYPGFIGVSVGDSTQGAVVEGVVAGGPAAAAGISAGDVITAVGTTNVTSGTGLKAALIGVGPGTSVRITWIDSSGSTHTSTITLIQGPAD